MDQQGYKRQPDPAGEEASGDTLSFDSQETLDPQETGPTPRKHRQSSAKGRRRRIPQRIYRRGRLAAFFYVAGSLAVCVLLAGFFLSAFNDVLAFNKPNQAVEVTITSKDTPEDVAAQLKEKGLIRYETLFNYIYDFEKVGSYQIGKHVLNTNMGYTTMMKAMEKQAEQRETVMVTIPEGLPMWRVAEILEENGVCDAEEFVERANNTNFGFDFEDEIPQSSKIFYPLEGYLFPDTYEFYKNDAPLNVIRRMLQNFDNKITPSVKNLMKQKGLSLHETITLASIVQAEASGEEMNRVSSVYHNRLDDSQLFPLLQADPTRDYANEQILTHIGDRDRRVADYYNTYTTAGLPPGAINNPGMAAIMAALQPEDTPYYYFCTDSRTKEFYYAETLEEHNRNVQKAGLRGWQ